MAPHCFNEEPGFWRLPSSRKPAWAVVKTPNSVSILHWVLLSLGKLDDQISFPNSVQYTDYFHHERPPNHLAFGIDAQATSTNQPTNHHPRDPWSPVFPRPQPKRPRTAPDTAPAALQDTALEEESKRRQAAAELYAQVGNPHIWMVETCFPMFSCRFSFQPSY